MLCNYCKEQKESEWEMVYGELPTHDYAFCCSEHIPDMIKSVSKKVIGGLKVLYLRRLDSEGTFDEHWNNEWRVFYRKMHGQPSDSTPLYLKAFERSLKL